MNESDLGNAEHVAGRVRKGPRPACFTYFEF